MAVMHLCGGARESYRMSCSKDVRKEVGMKVTVRRGVHGRFENGCKGPDDQEGGVGSRIRVVADAG